MTTGYDRTYDKPFCIMALSHPSRPVLLQSVCTKIKSHPTEDDSLFFVSIEPLCFNDAFYFVRVFNTILGIEFKLLYYG